MRTLSVTISDRLYDNLKHTVSSRQISKFVCQAVEEKLNQKRDVLYQAYMDASQDPERLQELKIWGDLDTEDWHVSTPDTPSR